MVDPTPVDRMYGEAISILEALGNTEPSLASAVGDVFRKALVLAAASHFEHRITTGVLQIVRDRSGNSTLLSEFVKNKAVARQYHTWFNWTDSNANQFFGLFGSEFKQAAMKRVNAADEISSSVRAFLEIGSDRNSLMHQDFASFAFNKTLDEVYALYQRASLFVDQLPVWMNEGP